ncbi:hypothetical protein GZ998_01630 [Actinomyces sp. 594]|uniref:hypothetical protein n=1 Tax=Actinomyces sp. 594 TaxID=2057793 RepID=UPI001C5935A7|nr:hypothetical protein [Actinomyces sp. 594]MBW3068221.1 hypothetical protein [Actinomyces sp. 594]
MPPLPVGCRPAPRQVVAESIAIDLAIVLLPLAVGLVVPGPALLRLALVLGALGLLLAQLVSHCLYGRAVGGRLLGLRTVDADAGLPTGTARSLLPLARLGAAAGAAVLDVRQGPDPSRGTLDDLDASAARALEASAASAPPQPPAEPQRITAPPASPMITPTPAEPATTAPSPAKTPPALRAVPAQATQPTSMPLPPAVPPQPAPPPPPPPEPAQQPVTEPLPQAPAPPRVTRKALRAKERERERARARQDLGFTDPDSETPSRMVG